MTDREKILIDLVQWLSTTRQENRDIFFDIANDCLARAIQSFVLLKDKGSGTLRCCDREDVPPIIAEPKPKVKRPRPATGMKQVLCVLREIEGTVEC